MGSEMGRPRALEAAGNREKKRAARRILLLCAKKIHESYVSLIVRDELNTSRDPYRSRDLGLVTRLGLRRELEAKRKRLGLTELEYLQHVAQELQTKVNPV